jgi:type II secretory pathway pseudopilin PulG
MVFPPFAMTPNLSIKLRPSRLGFSLVEVVVAVGIFAIAIVSVVGLVAAISRSVGEVTESDDGSRLVTNLQSKLQDVPFSALRSYMGDVTGKPANARIYASRDGSRVGRGDEISVWDADANGTISASENALKYFLIEMQSNDSLSPAANDGSAGFLAFNVRLIYPAHLGNGNAVTDSTQQNSLVFPVAVTR